MSDEFTLYMLSYLAIVCIRNAVSRKIDTRQLLIVNFPVPPNMSALWLILVLCIHQSSPSLLTLVTPTIR